MRKKIPKKLFAWLLCVLLAVMICPVAAADEAEDTEELSKWVSMENLRIDGSQVRAELVLTEGHPLTGLQVGISFNSSLLGRPDVQSEPGYFKECIVSDNGDCPIVTFMDGPKGKGGVFAKISFPIQADGLTEDDLLIYLLLRDKMTGDFSPSNPDDGKEDPPSKPEIPGDSGNTGGSGSGGSGNTGGSGSSGSSGGSGDAKDPEILTSYPDRTNTGLWVKYADGSWAFLQEQKPVADWKKVDGTWYFFSKDTGKMQTGWVKDKGFWYYLAPSGAMRTGWVKDKGAWYYLSGSGAMRTGWVLDKGYWYYLNPSGAMQTGWVQVKGLWYYLETDGQMLADTTTPDGYRVDQNGAWIQ